MIDLRVQAKVRKTDEYKPMRINLNAVQYWDIPPSGVDFLVTFSSGKLYIENFENILDRYQSSALMASWGGMR